MRARLARLPLRRQAPATAWWRRGLGALLLGCAPALSTAVDLDPYEGFEPTPTLELNDLGGQSHKLADYRGRVVLVNFWASWCTPCVMEMPGLQHLQDTLSEKPFTVLAVNVGESRGKVWNFASQMNLHLSMLLDSEGRTSADWQVTVYPSSFLIDREGRIRYVAVGPREWDAQEMIEAIEAMLAPATTTTQSAQ